MPAICSVVIQCTHPSLRSGPIGSLALAKINYYGNNSNGQSIPENVHINVIIVPDRAVMMMFVMRELTRYYDPATFRMLSQDSYRGEKIDPGTWNLYAYCGSNPINYIDPSGHKPYKLYKKLSTAVKKFADEAIVPTVKHTWEYATLFYKKKVKGKWKYAYYQKCTNWKKNSVNFYDAYNKIKNKNKLVAYGHTHPYIQGYNHDSFSKEDRLAAKQMKINAYLVSASGKIKCYSINKGNEITYKYRTKHDRRTHATNIGRKFGCKKCIN